ncbi:16S rRNA (guanine(966)-N(2))-methyltransferase RsmD [Nitrosomonas oligotropha]|uniref:16S rRNA (Guanine(966)-N(2))-methyltransferase RsmD n=1 Tax=Nitrosomonas oligotropha TaxID=42354 RepID=A0A1H8UA43_9PROT|nr:16S rRNA (guanine(966)-N(2))-methyltransferase RsmD [Nitrosomonas oligotropha]SDX26328.1 16S rRNA (guanine(966)-N(2))-methyltransferase RsmD [Nitrosomonas oligotropha]SEP00110.1 16S rRNA (guanine(966)-N(2))-methyltransferase RsmD [Nitrosomonas oligotropha]
MAVTRGKVRIIGGQWRSRLLAFPEHPDLRPTADRIRETLFNWLGQDLNGMRCLDLFAGSGALGFEAASRGATSVVMVDADAGVYRMLRENKEKLQATHVELVMMNAMNFLKSDMRKFDVIFLDPPYRLGLLPELLPLLPCHLETGGLVYAEAKGDWSVDAQWQVKRGTRAGSVHYRLLELAQHG